jgi:hypothetical protein
MEQPVPATAPRGADCRRCRHYAVTWDRDAPHGCRVYGFKSRRLPSLVVRESAGSDCAAFAEARRRAYSPK